MMKPQPLTLSRRVLITGAAGALGRAVLARFVAGGDSIFATHAPGETPSPIPGVEWIGVDLTQRNAVFDAFARIDAVDAVVHCAGGFRFGKIDAFSAEDFRFLSELNFASSFHVASAAAPGMKRRKGGTLLFVSSLATLNPAPGMSAYAASKAAVNAMVASLAAELKGDGIRVNAVLPSVIDTPANRRDMPDADATKWVPPAEIAELLYDLTLEKSRSITGALIPIAGRV